MEAWRFKTEPLKGLLTTVADFHHPDVEQCPDPDPHQIENFDTDPHPCEGVIHRRLYI
jgi:hypothetical protein